VISVVAAPPTIDQLWIAGAIRAIADGFWD
jgi:hypothetical protein